MTSPAASPTVSAYFDHLQSMLVGLDKNPEQLGRVSRQQAALLALGRRASVQPELAILMQDAVALVAEVLRAELSGSSQVADDGKVLTTKAAHTDNQGKPVDPVTHTGTLDPDTSMAAYALNAAAPITTSDLAAEKRFTDQFLRNLGVVTAMCIPLHLGDKAFGALAVYSKEQRDFTPGDVCFAETIAHLLTASVARVKAQQELHQRQTFASTVLDIVDAMVITLDVEGNVVNMNRACQRVTEFTPAAVRGRPLWSVFIAPEEVDLIQEILRRAKDDGCPCDFESFLLTKDSHRRRVAWSLKSMRDEGRQVQSFVLTGTDRTEQIETEAELQRVREIAQQATTALEELRSSPQSGDRSEKSSVASVEGALRWGGTASAHTPQRDEDSSAASGDQPRTFQPLDGKVGRELRSSARRAYRYRQMIAPMVGNRISSRSEFFEVQCRDISAGGMSFLLERPPDFDTLAVALGKPPAESYFVARVVRWAEVEENGTKKYLVGCHFTGRIQLQDSV